MSGKSPNSLQTSWLCLVLLFLILPVQHRNPHFAKIRGFQEKSRGKYSMCDQNCTKEEAQVDGSSNSKAPEISELREVPKLPELRGPNIYPLVNSSIKKLFSYPTQSYKIAGQVKHFQAN